MASHNDSSKNTRKTFKRCPKCDRKWSLKSDNLAYIDWYGECYICKHNLQHKTEKK